jgi:hypothetical protein
VILLGGGLRFLRGASYRKRIARAAAIGALGGHVGFLLFLELSNILELIVYIAMSFRFYGVLLIVAAFIVAAMCALGAAIARPGRLAAWLYWGGWGGFALLGFTIGALIAEDASAGLLVAGAMGSIGGLLAAAATRVFTREEAWDFSRLRAGCRGAALGVLVGGAMVGLGIYTYDYESIGLLWCLLAPLVLVLNAMSTAITRPGNKGAFLFWAAWAGFALLGGLAVGFVAGSLRDGVIAASLAGTVGGLLAALATRRWVRE